LSLRQIEVEELEIQRREKELVHSVRQPAEAEQHRIETLATAEQARQIALARSAAEAVRLQGLAEAEVLRARGEAEADAVRVRALAEAEGRRANLLAEAEGMQRKAEAWQAYSSAALSDRLIDKLPQLASAVAAPLSKIERMVLVNSGGGDGGSGVERITKGVTDVLAQLPALVSTMTGVDLSQLVAQVKSAMAAAEDTEPAGQGEQEKLLPLTTKRGHAPAGGNGA
jgi:flotillin